MKFQTVAPKSKKGNNYGSSRYIVVTNSLTLVWPVCNHGPNRRRGRPGGVSDQKEKTRF